MLVVASWLQEYLKKRLKPMAMAGALERAGIEVEAIHHQPAFDSKIVVAKVADVKSHPAADKLKLATVDIGRGRKVTVVCGAPNVAKGQKVAYAAVGATLPNGTKIGRAKIRGQESSGMIASDRELRLGGDHTGILVLEDSAEVGTPVSKIFDQDEVVIDAKTAANRPDLQSLRGLAREVAAQTDSKLNFDNTVPLLGETNKPTLFNNKVKQLVSRYALAQVKLPTKLPATPDWIRQRLNHSGLRPINLVVDITNYVMLETGQPLHAFDAAKITGQIVIRKAKPGEKIVTLDGKTRTLSAQDLVIADARKAIGIAGVMGGVNSQVTDKTKQVFLEAATFDGPSIRKTAISQGLRTEASARFERNQPVQLVAVGLNRALEMLNRLAKAKRATIEDELNVWPWVQHIGVRSDRLSQLAGTRISDQQIISSLRKLGFGADKFDIIKEAKKHLGKPYVFGAKYKTHGTSAFDCSYLTDYIYSLIGINIGHTAYEQSIDGRNVRLSELRPGDLLFRGGEWSKLGSAEKAKRKGVAHVAMYIGNQQVIDSRQYVRVDKDKWKLLALPHQKVVVEHVSSIVNDPQFLKSRRYVDDLSGWIAVTVPWWRPDVKTEEDVFEEVIKQIGLAELPATLPKWQPRTLSYDPKWSMIWDIRSALAGLGLFEVVTYPFVSRRQLQRLGLKPKQHLRLQNPRSLDQSYLRSMLLPGLLEAVKHNTQVSDEFGLFEEGHGFLPLPKKLLPKEVHKLGVIIQYPGEPYRLVKNVLDNLANQFNLRFHLQMVKKVPWLHPTRQADISVNRRYLGQIGQLHPTLVQDYKLKAQVGYLEMDFGQLLQIERPREFKPVSPHQMIKRDLTVEVDQKVTWEQVSQLLEAAGWDRVSYDGDYYGRDLGKGKRALTINLEIWPEQAGLTDKAINNRLADAAKLLQQHFRAKLRE